MNKNQGTLKLVGFSCGALLLLALILFIVLEIMLAGIKPRTTAAPSDSDTPDLRPVILGPTVTAGNPQLTPAMVTPSLAASNPLATLTPENPQLSPTLSFPAPTQAATPNGLQTWKQGLLVYLVKTLSGFNSIYTLDLETGTAPRLLLQPSTNQHFYGPWLSPDASKVVFYDINGSDGILDLQTLTIKAMEACNSPTWSPTGNQIICGSGGKFRLLDAGNGNFIRTLDAGVNGWLPVFSPDGTQVAFAVFGAGNSTSIWRISAAGGQALSLASAAFENYCPTWSPDGNWIAYQSGAENKGSEIWIMDRNGENKRQITSTPDGWSRGPVWSPDGNWLAYVATHSGTQGVEYGDIYVVSVNSGEIQQVTDTGGAVDNWRVSWGSVR